MKKSLLAILLSLMVLPVFGQRDPINPPTTTPVIPDCQDPLPTLCPADHYVCWLASDIITRCEIGQGWTSHVAGSGGGDQVAINGGSTVDPDFVSTGDIAFTNTSDTITADIAANAVSADELNATGVEAELENVLDLNELQGLLDEGQVPLATSSSALEADGLDNIGEIADALMTGGANALTLVSGSSVPGECAEFDANGNLIGAGVACGDAGGDETNTLTDVMTGVADDQVAVGATSGGLAEYLTIPDSNAAGEALQYDAANNTFSKITGLGAGGTVDSIQGDGNTPTTGAIISIDGGAVGIDTSVTGDVLTVTLDEEEAEAVLDMLGDVTGTMDATVVGDNSHLHTTASISGLDISADTDLAVTSPITLTDDTVGFDPTAAFSWTGAHDFDLGLAVNDQTFVTFYDADSSHYVRFQAPSVVGVGPPVGNRTCVFEDDESFIPDLCVGDGSDDVDDADADATNEINTFAGDTGDATDAKDVTLIGGTGVTTVSEDETDTVTIAATLGTDIVPSEISVAAGAGDDELCLSYEHTGTTWEYKACSGGAGGFFDQSTGVLHPSTATDDIGNDATGTNWLITDAGVATFVSVTTAPVIEPAVGFDDSNDSVDGTSDANIVVNCPTADDCDMAFNVDSGAGQLLQEAFRIDTETGGETTVIYSQEILADETGIGFVDGTPGACGSGEYRIYADGATLKKCINTAVSDLDTTGSGAWANVDPIGTTDASRSVRIGPTLGMGIQAKLTIHGNEDESQLVVESNGTQAAGNDLFNVCPDGCATSYFEVNGLGRTSINEAGDPLGLAFVVHGDNDSTLFVTDTTDDTVGIGTSDPAHKLHVVGPIGLTEQVEADADTEGVGQLWVNTAVPNELWFTDDSGADFQLGVGGGAGVWTDTSPIAQADTNETVLIGKPAPIVQAKLTIHGTANENQLMIEANSAQSAINEILEVCSDGCINSYFEVDGVGKTTVNTTQKADLGAAFTVKGEGDAALLVVDSTDDTVGVGTDDAAHKLHVVGSIGLTEKDAKDTAVDTIGQIWVDSTDDPSTLWFTDEDNTDFQLGVVNTADIADVAVTQTELAELQTIGAVTISANNWAALGGLDEGLTFTELNLLDDSNAARGDVMVGNASEAWSALAVGNANDVLLTDGTDPSWGKVTSANIGDNEISFSDIFYIPSTSFDPGPALLVGECAPAKSGTTGGIICEGNVADNFEQFYSFPVFNSEANYAICTNAEACELLGANFAEDTTITGLNTVMTFADGVINVSTGSLTVGGVAMQPADSELTTVAALAETTGNVMIAVDDAWASVAQPFIDGTNISNVVAAHADTITWTGTPVLDTGATLVFGADDETTITHTYDIGPTGTSPVVTYSDDEIAIDSDLAITGTFSLIGDFDVGIAQTWGAGTHGAQVWTWDLQDPAVDPSIGFSNDTVTVNNSLLADNLSGTNTGDNDEVNTKTAGDLCINDGTNVECTVNTEAELETALDATNVIVSTEIDTMAELNTLSTDTDAVLDTDIGSAVQAWDAELDTISGLSETTGNVMIAVGDAWASVAQPIIDGTNITNVSAEHGPYFAFNDETTWQGSTTPDVTVQSTGGNRSGVVYHEGEDMYFIAYQTGIEHCDGDGGNCSQCAGGSGDLEGITIGPGGTNIYAIDEGTHFVYEYTAATVAACTTTLGAANKSWDVDASFVDGGGNDGEEGLTFIATPESAQGGYFMACNQHDGLAAILEFDFTDTGSGNTPTVIADYNDTSDARWGGLVAVPDGAVAFDCSGLHYDSASGVIYRMVANEDGDDAKTQEARLYLQDTYGNTLAAMVPPGIVGTDDDPEGITIGKGDTIAVAFDDSVPDNHDPVGAYLFQIPRWYGPDGEGPGAGGGSTQEEIEDFVGGMVTGNTETGITVTYEDGDGTLDFVVTGGGGGGDSLSLAGAALENPNFEDTATVNITNTPASGWNEASHAHRKKFTDIASNISGGPHTDFPALISFTDTRLIGESSNDFVFTTSGGTRLPFDVAEFDDATGLVSAYVLIPSLASGYDLEFYFGDPSADTPITQNDSDLVWVHAGDESGADAGTGWVGVYHLEDTTLGDGATIANSATLSGDGSLTDKVTENVTSVDNGVDAGLGKALFLEDYINTATIDSQDAVELTWGEGIEPYTSLLSFSAWVYFDKGTYAVNDTQSSCDAGSDQHLFAVGDDSAVNSPSGDCSTDTGGGQCRNYLRCASGAWNMRLDGNAAVANGTVTEETWYWVTMLNNANGSGKLFVNGAQVTDYTNADALYFMPWDVTFGAVSDDNDYPQEGVQGAIDELRIRAGVSPTLAWHTTEYNNMTAMGTFLGTVADDSQNNLTFDVQDDSIDSGKLTADVTTRTAWQFVIKDPVADDRVPMQGPPWAGTMTRIDCKARGGTGTPTFSVEICDGEDYNDNTCTTDIITSGPLVVGSAGASATGAAIQNTGFAARDDITFIITAVAGTTSPDWADCMVTATVD